MSTKARHVTTRCRVGIAGPIGLGSCFLLVVSLVVVQAQEPQREVAAAERPHQVDVRWVPWLGCWQLAGESVRDAGLAAEAAAGGSLAGERDASEVMLCVAPTPRADGVTLHTMVGGQRLLEQTIVADGAQHALADPECRGWERAEWSRDGQRLYARAEITCGDQRPRTVSSAAIRAPGPVWIDIQVIEVDGRESIRVRRFHRADAEPPVGWPLSAYAPYRSPEDASHQVPASLTIEDVEEACRRLSPRAVEAALVETRSVFPLNGKRLIALDEAGVPDSIIDLMVALSFPRRFAVERAAAPPPWPLAYVPIWLGPWEVWLLEDYFDWSFYAPFGYAYWGWYDPVYYAGGGFIDVDPAPPRPHGRVVDGLGYTRIQPVDASTANAGMNAGGSGSNAQGGVSSQGYSSGGSGGGSDRTAQPRPPS